MAMNRDEARHVVRVAHGTGEGREKAVETICSLLGIDREALVQALDDGEESYIEERLVLREEGDLTRSRVELCEILDRLQKAAGSPAQTDEWIRVLRANIPQGVPITDLIYHSELVTPEAVLDAAFAHKSRVFQM